MTLRFESESTFHRAAALMVGGSVGFGAGAALVSSAVAAPLVGGVLGVGVGAALAYGKPWRLLLAGAAAVPLIAMPPIIGSLVLAAAALALCVSVGGPRGWKGVFGAAGAMLVALVGMWCAVKIEGARATEAWPLAGVDMASAGAFGMVATLALLVRHVVVGVDAVAAARKALPAAMDAEVVTLVDRAVAIYGGTAKMASEDRVLVRDGVLETIALAKQTCVPSDGSDLDLAVRIGELDKRIAGTSDAEAKAQYAGARAALVDQQRMRAERSAGRDRLVAKLHNQVATLEKFGLGAAN